MAALRRRRLEDGNGGTGDTNALNSGSDPDKVLRNLLQEVQEVQILVAVLEVIGQDVHASHVGGQAMAVLAL